MKKYNIDKIVLEIKQKEKEENKLKAMLNNLLPSTVEEFRQCILVNSIISKDYF